LGCPAEGRKSETGESVSEINIDTSETTEEQKATEKFQSAYRDMVATLSAAISPENLRLL
jgi:hypothetical protein